MRTRLRGRHALAALAPERVLEHERGDAELAGFELLEQLLRFVGPVVRTDSGVIPANDEVRTAVVLAADRVPDRLPRSRVAHGRREHTHHRPILRVVTLEEDLV